MLRVKNEDDLVDRMLVAGPMERMPGLPHGYRGRLVLVADPDQLGRDAVTQPTPVAAGRRPCSAVGLCR